VMFVPLVTVEAGVNVPTRDEESTPVDIQS
jgi:hypothetical protein